MPKTIHSKREDLICGKIDLAQEIAVKLNHIELLELLDSIRYDAVRMEQKLIIRKQEASKALNENLNLLNEAKILELEAHIWDLKSTIFNQEQLKAQIYEEYAKIKMKEAFVDGYEQGFERGQTGLGMFNLAQDKANEYYHTQAGRV